MPPKLDKKKILIASVCLIVLTCFMLFSYVYANQPGCPLCNSTNDVVFTWKSYQSADPNRHEFSRVGPVGVCQHYQAPRAPLPASQFSWFCTRCKKHVLRPPYWRMPNSND